MYTEKDLLEMIGWIKAAPPCSKHGRDFLSVCPEPGCKDVRCNECFGSCQCWNDE